MLLLLANVAFFGWSRYFAAGGSGADPAPLARQIEPEKLRIVPLEELARLAAPNGAALPGAARPLAAAPQSAALPKCVEWGSFTPAGAQRAEKALESLELGERLAQRTAEETAAWWVFIPPQPRDADPRQAALRKAGELKKLGVEDYFIVQEDGPHRWAVSLGVFRSEEAAQARLSALRDLGVRSARVGPRDTHVAKVWLQVKGVDAALEGRLQELARHVEGSELRECVP